MFIWTMRAKTKWGGTQVIGCGEVQKKSRKIGNSKGTGAVAFPQFKHRGWKGWQGQWCMFNLRKLLFQKQSDFLRHSGKYIFIYCL